MALLIKPIYGRDRIIILLMRPVYGRSKKQLIIKTTNNMARTAANGRTIASMDNSLHDPTNNISHESILYAHGQTHMVQLGQLKR